MSQRPYQFSIEVVEDTNLTRIIDILVEAGTEGALNPVGLANLAHFLNVNGLKVNHDYRFNTLIFDSLLETYRLILNN